MQEKRYLILAYYKFVQLADPRAEVLNHKLFFENRDVSGRIYISEQGINGQMSGSIQDASAYIDWMQSHAHFKDTTFKIHSYHENVFPRMIVKYRKQLVALDAEVDMSKTGEHVPPAQWKEMLETQKDHVLLDVRNDYEWRLGHFEGAELPTLDTFREFHAYAAELKAKVDPKKTPVMMYCTGGIRCELYSSLLKDQGFEKVYQLDGGIINYGLQEGSKHWKGKLFVFDDRLSVPISENEESEVIGTCHHCGKSNENYYNCANMDCNQLFLCCPECLLQFSGCCKEGCKEAPRLRPYQHQNAHKPFRRWYKYFDEKPVTESKN